MAKLLKPKYANRELWLAALTDEILRPYFKAKGLTLPPVRVSCGWPSSRGLGSKKFTIGECWDSKASTDKVHQIFISPRLKEVVDNMGVVATHVHECVHAAVGIKEGHKKGFRRGALAVGLEGKMTSTHAGEALMADIAKWSKKLGPYPHAQLNPAFRPTKKQTTRLIKCECGCGYNVRITRKWLDEVGAPICPCNKKPMRFEIPEELEGD